MSLEACLFLKLYNTKRGLLKSPTSPVSEHLWKVNMLKGAKHCINLHGNIFVIFFDLS